MLLSRVVGNYLTSQRSLVKLNARFCFLHLIIHLFTTIVEMGEKGVKVSHNNELMRQCSSCFQEALTLGQQVKHHSGCEGIDEVWGEPFKAFTMPVADFYQSRFVKIA